MALDQVSGASYNNTANITQRPISQDSGVVNLNISEKPATVKTTASGQTGNEQETGQKEKKLSEKQIKDAISSANNRMKDSNTRCEFAYQEDTKRISVKVINRETEEVIREIPSEETLKMFEKLWELTGLLVDEKR